MAHNGRHRRRLLKLWHEDNRCHFCNQPTILVLAPSGVSGRLRHIVQFAERATIDHLHSRLSGRKTQINDGTESTVLACYECNQRRNDEEQSALPIDELHRRGKRYPRKEQKGDMK